MIIAKKIMKYGDTRFQKVSSKMLLNETELRHHKIHMCMKSSGILRKCPLSGQYNMIWFKGLNHESVAH